MIAALPPPALSRPAFEYTIEAGAEGYSMGIEMVFSKDVSLARVVANFRDDELIHELYENAEPGKTTPTSDGRYDRELSIRNFGLRTRMLSHCQEQSVDPVHWWGRECELDLKALDGGARMTAKHEAVECRQLDSTQPVRCRMSVRGAIKPFWFITASVLTVKAKAQALINWGRFWFYTEAGSISAKASNEVFDRSELARNIEEFSRKGLLAAKGALPFRLAVRDRFEGPAVR